MFQTEKQSLIFREVAKLTNVSFLQGKVEGKKLEQTYAAERVSYAAFLASAIFSLRFCLVTNVVV
jgi:hypothetical protein